MFTAGHVYNQNRPVNFSPSKFLRSHEVDIFPYVISSLFYPWTDKNLKGLTPKGWGTLLLQKVKMKSRYAWENYQRAIVAFLSILLTFLAFLSLVIVGGVPDWTRINLEDRNDVAENGHITFGLFRGEVKIDSGFSDIARRDDFNVGENY